MKKIFLTGGSGFLGSHLLEELLEKKYDVLVLVKPGEDVSFLQKLGISYALGDLLAPSSYQDHIPRGAIVVHAAALTPGYKEKREHYFRVNVAGTESLLAACANKKISRFVFISSGSVYGFTSSSDHFITEESPLAPDSFYGESKLAAEKVVLSFCAQKKIPFVILRPFVFFGERMPLHCGGATLFKMVRAPLVLSVRGISGFYDYSYVKNIVSGIVLTLAHPAARNQIYNLTNISKYRYVDLLRLVRQAVHPSALLIPLPFFLARAVGFFGSLVAHILGKKVLFSTRSLDLLSGKFVGDSSKMVRDLNYVEPFSLVEGVRRTTLWLQKNW